MPLGGSLLSRSNLEQLHVNPGRVRLFPAARSWTIPHRPDCGHQFCTRYCRKLGGCTWKNRRPKTSSRMAPPGFIPILPNHPGFPLPSAAPPPLSLTGDRPSTAILSTPFSTPLSNHHRPPTLPINSQLLGCPTERDASHMTRVRVGQWL